MFAPFEAQGVGLHSGEPCRARVSPGPAGSGVLFATAEGEVPARVRSLSLRSQRATVLSCGRASVGTVEHLLAALAWFGEADARVDVEGPEIPILDGSAAPWVERLAASGARPGPRMVPLARAVAVEEGPSRAFARPLDPKEPPQVRVLFFLDGPGAREESLVFAPLEDDFAALVAPARTFATEEEARAIKSAGLARGGSLANALVIGPNGPLNPEGARFEDEPVRHKMLDALGDLFLLGGWPLARVTLTRPGHALNHALARAIAQAQST
ncbi:MAG: UDP-3-O-acyl-N-acetylglucosamine deacetylase [Deltaproteobacteria bacterium]|nr:UDP-3-O-acyl-N-acetylglucosamine deacetylase [Deltaproteobacteria bacterium]